MATRISVGIGFALLALLGGCNESGGGKSGGGIIAVTPHPKAPMEYQLADPECQTKGTATALTNTRIFAWDQDEVVEQDVTLSGLSSTKYSLVGPSISETTFDMHYERVCDLRRGVDAACDDLENGGEKPWFSNDRESGGYLKVCKDGFAYPRDSYESVALTSAYYIEKANARYMQLAENPKVLPQITLTVLPHFIDYYDNFVRDGETKRLKTWITHNLAYFQGGQMIAVFPENVIDGPGAKGAFWESEFVLAHEYGHHIDWSRHGGALTALGLRWDAVRHGFVDDKAISMGQLAVSGRGQIAGSAAEGFADLLAYYSEGANSNSLVGLADLGVNRDIGGETFSNGDAKVLTEDRMAQLLSGEETATSDASAPRYTDIHVIGAIIAHTLDDTFQTVVTSDPTVAADSDASIKRRYQLTLAWMDAFVSEIEDADGASGMALAQPLADAVETAVDGYLTRFPLADDPTADAVRAEVCQRVKAALPAVPKAPFCG